MPITLAFDVYGTLINTHGIVFKLEALMADKASAFSYTWREKQLEYSFRRGLMCKYENFAVCTRQALDYSCNFYNISLTSEQKNNLLEYYQVLPVFDDVRDGLKNLQAAGLQLYAFSNGTRESVQKLLLAAGISEFFIDI